jgi:hypothetical protein
VRGAPDDPLDRISSRVGHGLSQFMQESHERLLDLQEASHWDICIVDYQMEFGVFV